MAVATKLTWEEFEKLPDDGWHHELLQGEHIALPPPQRRHSRTARRVFRLLDNYAGCEAHMEAGFRLGADSWVQPDVSVLRPEQQHEGGDGYFEGPPALAVKVVSPSETARVLQRKTDRLLARGATEVWVLYPDTKQVQVFRRSAWETKYSGDTLTTALLPGWKANVADFFAD